MIDPDVSRVLRAVPEFAERYLNLVDEADGDPGAAAAYCDLAEFAAELAGPLERHAPVLERLMGCIEAVARESEAAEELVAWSFLDALAPDDLRRLEPWMGPETRAVLDRAELAPELAPGPGPGGGAGPDPGRAEGRP
ncbi:MAG TPA: hypothetical protein VMV14_03250 [Acidimicrobiales bacterium]|nr:hypothetical protein [Acidimicrobiales bacterium]